jgi:hypothetical protein
VDPVARAIMDLVALDRARRGRLIEGDAARVDGRPRRSRRHPDVEDLAPAHHRVRGQRELDSRAGLARRSIDRAALDGDVVAPGGEDAGAGRGPGDRETDERDVRGSGSGRDGVAELDGLDVARRGPADDRRLTGRRRERDRVGRARPWDRSDDSEPDVGARSVVDREGDRSGETLRRNGGGGLDQRVVVPAPGGNRVVDGVAAAELRRRRENDEGCQEENERQRTTGHGNFRFGWRSGGGNYAD